MDTKSTCFSPCALARFGGVLLLLGSLAICGCGGGGGGGTSSTNNGIFITSNGGEVAFPALTTSNMPPAVAHLNTQAGCVNSAVNVNMTVVATPFAQDSQQNFLHPINFPSGLYLVDGGMYQLTSNPAQVTFNNPVTLVLNYNSSTGTQNPFLPGPPNTTIDLNTCHIFEYNGTTWVPLGNNIVNPNVGSAMPGVPYSYDPGVSVADNQIAAQFTPGSRADGLFGSTVNNTKTGPTYFAVLANPIGNPINPPLAKPAQNQSDHISSKAALISAHLKISTRTTTTRTKSGR